MNFKTDGAMGACPIQAEPAPGFEPLEPTPPFKEPFSGWSPQRILEHFQRRNTPHYFPVIDPLETARDKIDGIANHVFTFNGETHALRPPVPWTVNPSPDREWLILLHKFYYAVGLGMAYAETRKPQYARTWMALTESWLETVPLDFFPSDVAGRRIQNWIFAQYYFVHRSQAPEVSPAWFLRFLASLAEQVDYLCDHLTPARNHRTLELCAILLAGIVFPEFRRAAEWVQFGRSALCDNLRADFLDDGVHCELSTDYHHLVLKNFLWIRRLAQMNRMEFPQDVDDLMQRALEFSVHVHKPDGDIPALSDGDSRSFLDLLTQGYELYGHDHYRYVGLKGRAGRPPTERSKGFPRSGYYLMRSGWGEEAGTYELERYLVIDCGPLGAGNHGHLDVLNVEMAAYGRSLIVDPGRYTYDESGPINWRVRFRETAAHNTVLVDGKNQTRYLPGKEKFKIKGPAPDHEVKTFLTKTEFDFFHGVARSHEYPAIHERFVFFVCQPGFPQYWIVSDRLTATESHTYDLRFHLSPVAMDAVRLQRRETGILLESPYLVLAHPDSSCLIPTLEEGFISTTYGFKHAAPIVQFRRVGDVVWFHTILLPYHLHKPLLTVIPERITVDNQACPESEAASLRIGIRVDGADLEDLYFLNPNPGPGRYAILDRPCDGRLWFLRRDGKGSTIREYRIGHLESDTGPRPSGDFS